jgi:hypothetical protein
MTYYFVVGLLAMGFPVVRLLTPQRPTVHPDLPDLRDGMVERLKDRYARGEVTLDELEWGVEQLLRTPLPPRPPPAPPELGLPETNTPSVRVWR